MLSVGTLVVGGVACHLGAHGGGCSVPSYGTGQFLLVIRYIKDIPVTIVLVDWQVHIWSFSLDMAGIAARV